MRGVSTDHAYLERKRRDYETMGYPSEVAKAQASYDLDALILRAWIEGATLREMGARFDRTLEGTRQRAHRHHRRLKRQRAWVHTSPIEKYASGLEVQEWKRWTS